MEHRRADNVGIIHRGLIHKMAEAMIGGDQALGSAVLEVLRRHFLPGKPLAEELALHHAILESRGVPERVARRVIADVLRAAESLDHPLLGRLRRGVLIEASRLVDDLIEGCEAWPDYRVHAAVGALVGSIARGRISESVSRARLEEDLVRWMSSEPPRVAPPDPARSSLALRLAVESLSSDISSLPPESQRLVDALLVCEASGDMTRYRRLAEGEREESLAALRSFQTDDPELASRVAMVAEEVERADARSPSSARTLVEARMIVEEARR